MNAFVNKYNINIVNMIVTTANYKFKYPKIHTPKVCLSKEIERHKQHLYITNMVCKIFKKYNIKPKKNTLKVNVEKIICRFIISNLSEKICKVKDGLYHHHNNDVFFKQDISTIFIINKLQLDKIVKEINICKMFNLAIEKIKKYNDTSMKLIKTKNKNITYYSTKSSPKLSIPDIVKNKLLNRYLEYKENNTKKVIDFDEAVYMLLLRYYTFNSGNQQSGMPYEVRDKFKLINYDFECFASSLNHHLKYYCSMFYDIEKIFMSLGFFQNITYIKGCYMANPPYEINLLNKLVTKFIESCKSNEDIMFMFGLPDWERFGVKFDFLEKTKNSKFKKYEFKLPAYKYKWVNFMIPDSVVKIPSSYRFVLSNTKINKIKHHNYNKYWGTL